LNKKWKKFSEQKNEQQKLIKIWGKKKKSEQRL
jgi:hypothetical protein